jgi:hypothetical protein
MTFPTPRPDAELDDLLRALAEDESRVHTPPHVEAAVMARWSPHPRGFGETGHTVLRRGAAIAAGLTIVIGLARLGQHLERAAAQPPARETATLVLVGEPFLAGERVRVVRMRMPASTLTALGVSAIDGSADTVDLDVVVGEDGVARAVRIGM